MKSAIAFNSFNAVFAIKNVATKNDFHKICFSGGVFQNGLLIDLVNEIMRKKCNLYYNKNLSPNDENISFGQLVRYEIGNMKHE